MSFMLNQDGGWVGDSNGIWQKAVPEPYRRHWVFLKPFRCVFCAEKFFSERHYQLHYRHDHTDGKIYKRTPKGLVEIKPATPNQSNQETTK